MQQKEGRIFHQLIRAVVDLKTPPRVIILSVSKAFQLFATQLIVLSSLNCLGNTSFPKEVGFSADFYLEKVRHWLASFKTTENSVFVDLT